MRISDWSSDVCSSDLVYSNPLNPFLDGTAETGRTVNRFAYQTKPHAQIFTTDNNVRFSFDTGPFSHELLAGVDYSNYFERTFPAPGMGKIGRATGRERVWKCVEIAVVAVSLKKTNRQKHVSIIK